MKKTFEFGRDGLGGVQSRQWVFADAEQQEKHARAPAWDEPGMKTGGRQIFTADELTNPGDFEPAGAAAPGFFRRKGG